MRDGVPAGSDWSAGGRDEGDCAAQASGGHGGSGYPSACVRLLLGSGTFRLTRSSQLPTFLECSSAGSSRARQSSFPRTLCRSTSRRPSPGSNEPPTSPSAQHSTRWCVPESPLRAHVSKTFIARDSRTSTRRSGAASNPSSRSSTTRSPRRAGKSRPTWHSRSGTSAAARATLRRTRRSPSRSLRRRRVGRCRVRSSHWDTIARSGSTDRRISSRRSGGIPECVHSFSLSFDD